MVNVEFDQVIIDNLNVITVLICYCVGVIIKKWVKDVSNRLIPTIVAVLGVIISLWVNESFTPQVVLSGLLSGLASCGVFDWIQRLNFTRKHTTEQDDVDNTVM